jgi:AcrR family transcriptional regulator
MDPPRTTRPGGRTARTATAVLAAAIEELSVRDYADISVESIAARAGVHKTTVYRRWGSKVEIIKQALIGAAGAHIRVPDTGSVDGDVLLLARAVQVVLSPPQGAAITTALIVGGLASTELAEVMRQFWEVRLEAISVIVDRAVSRGELPAGTDPAALMHTVAAPLYYQLLVARVPVTEADADLAAAAALAAAKAGVFAAPPAITAITARRG